MLSRRHAITYLALALVAPLVLGFTGCSRAKDPWDKVEGGKLKVLVSFPPLYCFTKAVAGNDARVLSLLAPTGPHEHQATADDAHLAAGADLILINGLGLDEFVIGAVNNSGNRKAKPFEVAEALPKSELLHLGEHGHGHGHEGHNHGEWDPHVWLGVPQAILMVKEIAVQLKKADPDHASGYDERAAAYVKELEKLQDEGTKLFAGKNNKKLIATHDALGYFCKSFGLELEGSIMPRPGIEADGAQMAKLQELCKDKNIRLIAIEPQYPKGAAETLQRGLRSKGHNIDIVTVDPLETADRKNLRPEYYLEVMRANVKNLADKMQ